MSDYRHALTYPAPDDQADPVARYLERLSPKTLPQARSYLRQIGRLLGADRDGFDWSRVRASDSVRIRDALVARYARGTVRNMISCLVGVLAEAMNLGLLSPTAYHVAVDPFGGARQPRTAPTARLLAMATTAAVGVQDSRRPTVREARAAFAPTLVGRSPRTALNYQSALHRFEEFLEATGRDPAATQVEALPVEILETFFTWLLATRGRDKRRTAAIYVAEVQAFIRFCDRRRWLAPGVSFEAIKEAAHALIGDVPYPVPRIDARIARIVTLAQDSPLPSADDVDSRATRLELLRDRAILTTLLGTAARRAELVRLDRADVHARNAGRAIITGKGNKDRALFFDAESLAACRAYLVERADAHMPLFLRHDEGRGEPGPKGEHWRLSPQTVGVVVKKYGTLAGVATSPHQLRHLKASVLLNNGAQLSEVQDILGHASPETTKKIYAHYTTRHLRASFDKHSRTAAEIVAAADEENDE